MNHFKKERQMKNDISNALQLDKHRQPSKNQLQPEFYIHFLFSLISLREFKRNVKLLIC